MKKTIKKPLGVTLFHGVSPFTGRPYVVVAVFGKSTNNKTGDMIQVYILDDGEEKPTETAKNGNDKTVCGDCPLRGILGKMRRCYVNLGQGPRSVWETYKRGAYPEYDTAEHKKHFAGRLIRWGAYGEPVLIPVDIVSELCEVAEGWTGYTHQFRRPEFQAYRRFFMASVHGEGWREAVSLGWRFFHSSADGEAVPGSFLCPASAEAGKRLTCATCLACYGNDREVGAPQAASVRLGMHGGFGVMAAVRALQIVD